MSDIPDLSVQLHAHLTEIYGEEKAAAWEKKFADLIHAHLGRKNRQSGSCIEEHSSLLITYADSLRAKGKTPLAALSDFLEAHVGEAISTVHLLPFYPYSSDDGFSVIDPLSVNSESGSWEDIHRINRSYNLMFDLVANHLSQYNASIQKYLDGDPEFADFAIEVKGDEDISQVFRPRALPLFSTVTSAEGNSRKVWTTFSADQVDINYGNPKVLLFILEVLLTYISRGASLVRLDAIAFIWKELGTSCIHQENTHRIIQFFRWAMETCAPGAGIITETNVPHKENISYFGDGHNEASLVYNFPLPPLTLHTFLTGDSTKLSRWASTLEFPSEEVTYFNFLASHDGIGVVPAQGILTQQEITAMAEHVQKQGGFVSYRSEGDGTKSPYELNCSYLSALSDVSLEESHAIRAARFIASQAIMLSLRGIPGIYIHSLLGSENCLACPDLLSNPRRINREKLQVEELEEVLDDDESIRSLVLSRYLQLLTVRKKEKAFQPSSAQRVLVTDPSLFILMRGSQEGERIISLINVTDRPTGADLKGITAELGITEEVSWMDLLSDSSPSEEGTLILEPYTICWLKG